MGSDFYPNQYPAPQQSTAVPMQAAPYQYPNVNAIPQTQAPPPQAALPVGKASNGMMSWDAATDMFRTDDNGQAIAPDASFYAYGQTPDQAAALRAGMISNAAQGRDAFAGYGTNATSAGMTGAVNQFGIADAAQQAADQARLNTQDAASWAGAKMLEGYNDFATGNDLRGLSGAARTQGQSSVADQAAQGLLAAGSQPYQPSAGLGAAAQGIRDASGNGQVGAGTQAALGNLNAAGNTGPGQLATSGIQAIQDAARAPGGPSAAELQMRQGLDTASANAMGLASSGRGRGQSGAAMQQALGQQAANQQEAVAKTAQLRAQEEAARRGENLQALTAAGQLSVSADTAARERAAQAAATGAGLMTSAEQAARQQQLQAATAAGGLEAEIERARQSGDMARVNALQAAAQTGLGQGSLALEGTQLAGNLTQNAGTFDMGVNQMNQANQQAWLNSLLGVNQFQTGAQFQGLGLGSEANQAATNSWLTGNEMALNAAMGGEQLNQDWLNRLYDTYGAEADRKAQLWGAYMGNDVAMKTANQQADVAGDQGIAGMVGMGLGAVGLL